MKPGRPLDARVAVTMGWVGVAVRRRSSSSSMGVDEVLLGLPANDASSLADVPNYSTSEKDALSVLWFLRHQGWNYTIVYHDGRTVVTLTHRDHGTEAKTGESGESFAHAMCLALLAPIAAEAQETPASEP